VVAPVVREKSDSAEVAIAEARAKDLEDAPSPASADTPVGACAAASAAFAVVEEVAPAGRAAAVPTAVESKDAIESGAGLAVEVGAAAFDDGRHVSTDDTVLKSERVRSMACELGSG
jgi:hypothetical protein